MVSIIIPVYKEPYLNKTIDSLLDNAEGEIEILVVLDGDIPEEPVRNDPRVRIVVLKENHGMRGAINAGISESKGDWIMKLDAHCIVCPGFDQIVKDCRNHQLMAPRRYSLHEVTWTRDDTKTPRDYHYLAFPIDSEYGHAFAVQEWFRRGRGKIHIDNVMTIQGSCWLANKKYFMEHVGYMDDRPETYGSWAQDQQELCFKYWLGGGEVKVNKNFWYAHLQKRGYHYKAGTFSHRYKKNAGVIRGNEWGTKHWMNDEEPGMIHRFEWWVEKFSPIPTWPEDWRKVWNSP